MRTARASLAGPAVLLLAACAGGRNVSAPSPASDAAAMRAVLDTTAAGWNRGELAVYMSAYADSTTSMGSNGIVRGKDGTEQVMRQGFWRNGRPAQQLRYDHVEVRMLGTNNALVTGQFILSGAGRPDRTGWFTTIWARTSHGWRMIHDHSG